MHDDDGFYGPRMTIEEFQRALFEELLRVIRELVEKMRKLEAEVMPQWEREAQWSPESDGEEWKRGSG